jgi:hypothetical protein
VVSNGGMKVPPEFILGSSQLTYNGEGLYEAQTGNYKTEATTPIDAADYPTGDLFPFESAWAVYAGDCPADKVESASTLVEPGVTKKVQVPLSIVNLSVHEGTFAEKKVAAAKGEYEVKITNTGCAESPIPNNASALNIAHIQKFKEGQLQSPFQPFGEYKLCLYNSELKRTYTVNYTNKAVAGSSPTIYLGQKVGEKESKEVTVAEFQKSC